ncbi:MAG TPA: glycerol-3-phosphate 1-O-acyltransferase PlsY [Candidatus Angelobacter sp.]|jgi:glycerol-3-phosphate acyltransferase PlsY|nr:glycerol-3-phosphate 1-O-acyltransferase PlsY [Candidatus Angelobacter sp.]
MLVPYIIVAAAGYFLGAIPFGFLLVKIFRGEDIRLSGSGNIGATNVARSGARGLGLATLILDALKGFLAVWFASILGSSSYNSCSGVPCIPATRLMAAAALAAVLGHIFPVWLRFRGGKGVAVAVGAFGLLFPKALLVTLVLFVVVVALTRYVSLGSILGAIMFPVAAYFVEHAKLPSVLLVSAIGALIVLKHSQNIRRLLAGNENRFGAKKAPEAGEHA